MGDKIGIKLKFSLKCFLSFILIVLLALVLCLNKLALPLRVIEIRSLIATTEVDCERNDFLKHLGFHGFPTHRTFDPNHSQVPLVLCESWDVTPGYEAHVSYRMAGEEIVFLDAILWDCEMHCSVPATGRFRKFYN